MIVNNNLLFSHTYLARLQADPSHDEAAAPIAQGLRDWMPFRDTSSLQSLIDSWVGPVFDFLEFHHAPADNAPHIRLLYARRGDETPIGLCYVVPPGQDGSTGSPHGLDDTTKGQHPMAQAVLALRARNLRWGMLTDGARWRLVDAQALRRYEHYVEVDLDELARSDDPTPLRLFYAFFHRSAFTPAHPPAGGGTEGGGESGLDRLAAASTQATKAAEDHLKALVSHNEGIMAQLCLGLVRADGRTHYTEAERDAIYRDAAYLLYRILFILYAEARGLLPLDNPAYRAVSLAELVKTAHTYKLHGMPDPQATTLWERLKRLCTAIYESDPALGIPAYNGGLFDDADKPYLRNGHIADAYLTEALFDLAYMPGKVTGTSEVPGASYRPIDYRDLSVRHLGSLYEGMIEYKLHIAEETLWARREKKGNVRFLRTGQDGAPRKTDVEIEPGQVYFSQSPGERRATGTYYTPEYIVHYIVSQTVVRGLEERRAPLKEKLTGWLEEITTATDPDERARMQRTADEELLRFVEEEVLTFRACDPAMGSGHFLVNTSHQITNLIVETLHLTPWENPTIDADPTTWRRQVVERCLYGVDLSLMAVELAKLSLWLASVAEGKPLSFLDHHLRQGNSLIGARLEDLAEVLAGVASTRPSRQERKAREAGQLSMLDDPAFSQHVTAATDLLAQISARIVERVEDIKAQEADYEQVRAELEPYRRLADLWTAPHFGVYVDEQQLRATSGYLVNGAVSRVPEYERILTRTQELAHERSFFHWGLEFPEVFLDLQCHLPENEVGFDAVVGNPPYVRGRVLPSEDKSYYDKTYSTAYKSYDLYIVFLKQSLGLINGRGLQAFILPYSLLNQSYGEVMRKYMLERTQVEQIVDLSGHRVFEDAIVVNCIPVIRKLPPTVSAGPHRIARYIADDQNQIVRTGYTVAQSILTSLPQAMIRLDLTDQKLAIARKMEKVGIPFGDLAYVSYSVAAHSEVEGKKKEAYVFDYQASDKCQPFMEAREIERYSINYGGRFLHYDPNIARRPGLPELFETQKLMFRDVVGDKGLIVAMDSSGLYADYSVICATLKFRLAGVQRGDVAISEEEELLSRPYKLEFTLACLDSRLANFYFKALLDCDLHVYPDSIRSIPIRRIEFTTPTDTRAALLEEGKQLYGICTDRGDQDPVLGFVERQLTYEPERSHVVHDLLAYLAQQMIDLHKERQRLEREADLFRFVERETPCMRLDKALGGPLGAGEMIGGLSAVRHDIEGLRLSQEADGDWLLEMRTKLRDPESGWREHRRDKDGNFIRQWLPVYRLPLDEATGRFYHYAFAHLGGFDGAGKFPGGYTRTTLEKLKATKVPKFVPVDLAPLAALENELAEVRRRIQLTDDLIDQIVYKLYGLTEEEIAIVEGQAD